MIANSIFLILILLPWLYVAFKFNLVEKINSLLNSLFFDDSKCNCQNLDNGQNKLKKGLINLKIYSLNNE